MKKFAVIFILVFSIFMMTACGFGTSDTLVVTGKNVIYMGEFNYSDYQVEFKDKKTQQTIKTETLTEDMLDDNSKMNVFGEGKKTLHITIGDLETTFEIEINRKTFQKIGFFTTTYFYTGSDITINLEGELPQDATIYYPLGNTFKNCGVYDISCIVSHQYYETKTYTAKITIERSE